MRKPVLRFGTRAERLLDYIVIFILYFLILLALFTPAIGVYMSKVSCSNYLDITKKNGRWDWITGCYVEVNGELIHLDQLRKTDILEN